MTKILKSITIMLVAVSLLAAPALAQDPMPPRESLEDAFKAQKHFSPYAGRNFPTQVFWGDTHLHTGLSMDESSENHVGLVVNDQSSIISVSIENGIPGDSAPINTNSGDENWVSLSSTAGASGAPASGDYTSFYSNTLRKVREGGVAQLG